VRAEPLLVSLESGKPTEEPKRRSPPVLLRSSRCCAELKDESDLVFRHLIIDLGVLTVLVVAFVVSLWSFLGRVVWLR
jgi:hypothetical protein